MDRNYKEDQNNEIEALESIYYNELESKEKSNAQRVQGTYSFSFNLKNIAFQF